MSWIDGFRHRIAALIAGDAYRREQQDELAHHLELDAMRRKKEGAEDGYAAARRRLGNVTGISEEMRRVTTWGWLDQVTRDGRYAIRSLRRSPMFAGVVAGIIALGIGANAATLSILHQLFTRLPGGVAHPEQLRFLYVAGASDRDPAQTYVNSSLYYPQFASVRDANADTIAAFTWDDVRFREGENVTSIQGTWVSPDYFSVLGAAVALGRTFGPDEGRIDAPTNTVVLSYDFWRRRFAMDSGVIGRSIMLERTRYVIVGVASERFTGLVLEPTEVFLPLNTYPGHGEDGKPWYQSDNDGIRAFTRVSGAAMAARIADRSTRAYKSGTGDFATDSNVVMRLAAANEARIPGTMEREVAISWRVAGVALLLFLISCANVSTLLLVRATKQSREIAVRLALGASRSRIFSHLVSESALFAIAGGIAAVGVAWWGSHTLRALLIPSIDWSGHQLDGRILAAIAAMSIVVTIIGSVAPVVLARRRSVIDAMKGAAGSGTGHRSRARSGLVVVQTAFSVVLIAGAALFVRSLDKVQSIRTGYAADSILSVSPGFFPSPGQRTELDAGMRALRSRMLMYPGVTAGAFASSSPMGGWTAIGLKLPGRDSVPTIPGGSPHPMLNWVSPEYFATVGTRLVEGRAFAASDSGRVVIVNQLMAKTFWPGENPLGKCILHATDTCAYVVGVTEDAHRFRILEDPSMNYFLPSRDALTLILRIDPERRRALTAQLQKEVAMLFPQFDDMNVGALSERMSRQLRPWRLGASIFVAFALLAVFVAMIGVYSVIAYAVSLRMREMGVRVAMGARAADLIRLVVGNGIKVVAIGAVVGIGATLALGKLVASVLYGVTPRDPLSLGVAALLFLIVGVLAALIPAWRASRADPVSVLRAD